MKKLAIVTATANPIEAEPCMLSWIRPGDPTQVYVVYNGIPHQREVVEGWNASDDPRVWGYYSEVFLGMVPAFAIGVQKALDDEADLIACFHDDLEILDPTWVDQVQRIFKVCPHAGLVGFGGALGLAHPHIYQLPYDPMQLARRGFLSNMRDAEAHGQRTTSPQRIAVLDGFSQIGTAAFWRGWRHDSTGRLYEGLRPTSSMAPGWNLFTLMQSWGLVHHAYDAALGAFAKQLGYQVWLAPVACHHYGGRTAVGNAQYQAWAQSQVANGDQGFWREAHRIVYDRFRGILPVN